MSQATAMDWINRRVEEVKAKSINEDDQHDCISERLFSFAWDTQYHTEVQSEEWQYSRSNAQYFNYYWLMVALDKTKYGKCNWSDYRVQELELKAESLEFGDFELMYEDCYWESQSKRLNTFFDERLQDMER